MKDLVTQLGINWKIIIAQIVNFSILAFFLTKFLYKPIIKMLDDRKNKLENDEKKSLELSEKVKSAEIAKEEVLSLARKESEKIIKQSEKGARDIKDGLLKEAELESEKIKIETRKQIQAEKEKVMEEVKKDLGGLISLSIEKALGNVTDKNIQNNLVEEAVKIAKKQ
jgi:F-type H+-transporting ATPase subunit b